MGVKMYWIVVFIVLILGQLLPQTGYSKKIYVALMAILHSVVCGLRYKFITGDLVKYSNGYTYYYLNPEISWFDNSIMNDGRNFGFEWAKKGISFLAKGDFQIFLIVLAILTEIGLAILIYKYSPRPWLSYLVWNCFGFYVTYGFCAIKQGMAMAILVFAMICVFEKKFTGFLVLTIIAGCIHMPAFAFLPVYWIMNRSVDSKLIISYMVIAGVTYLFRGRIVHYLQEIYYAGNDEVSFTLQSDGVGGRVIVIVIIAIVGIILRGFQEKHFEELFHIVILAAIFQLFSSFDNIFTRFADYYLQFLVLYIPMIFYEPDYKVEWNNRKNGPLLYFNDRSMKIFVLCLVCILLWWYWRTMLGAVITYEPDNYLNYRFMWDVIN